MKDALLNDLVVGNFYIYFTGKSGSTDVICQLTKEPDRGAVIVKPFYEHYVFNHTGKTRLVTASKLVPIDKNKFLTNLFPILIGRKMYINNEKTRLGYLSQISDNEFKINDRIFTIDDITFIHSSGVYLR